ncbi:MAG: HAMP domain-containing protein [Alphaproteobacteria bacterium]|nr:HAMP domain-containing protein [Alphaproteobacteria bacterium]MDE2013706.1 HAMP domain-containing protein [Alphaproteobacteria bacterium]MDE2351081.1 HAMP domain-containing protein [Alphaproteobacteria bacterium]
MTGGWHPFRSLRRTMPRKLFGRSLIIIVAPMVLLQGMVTYAFFVRHYSVMTRHLSSGVAASVAYLVDLSESHPDPRERKALLDMAANTLNYQITYLPGQHIAGPAVHAAPNINDILSATFTRELSRDHHFTSRMIGRYLDLSVEVKGGVLRLMIPDDRIFAGNADIFVLWMVVSAFLLLAIAIIFLRNQVRPIERLALAADAFGRGRAVPDFKPRGASEVRSAAQAFLTMRARIERHVQQRTEMLAGVSHDLKTPLTRMKLQLAMMDETADTQAMRQDVADMERLLDEYLDFARGEGGEEATATNLSVLVQDVADAALRGRADKQLVTEIEPGIALPVRPHALRRCLNNLVDNALKHGSAAQMTLRSAGRNIEILVDDNGPGIPEARREEAFRPFHRLDQGRNLQAGGSGLGLAIARDIARAHGGDLALATSPLGGLRATIRLPV